MNTRAHDSIVLLSTSPDGGTAVRFARGRVEREPAAWVNIIDPVHSIYRWRGEAREDREALLMIKAPAKRLNASNRPASIPIPMNSPKSSRSLSNAVSSNTIQWINEP